MHLKPAALCIAVRLTCTLIAWPTLAYAGHSGPADAASIIAEQADNTVAGVPSTMANRLIDWIRTSHDNGPLPFIVIDKVAAQLFVFDFTGELLAEGPVLVGIAKGDDPIPGIGDQELSKIPKSARTTPAGRFLASFGPAAGESEDVLWVNYDDAVSLHPVIVSHPKERRLARLKSATPDDNRISYGCINVANTLYSDTIEPLFRPAGGVVYVLPEIRPLNEVFVGIPPDPELPTFSDALSELTIEPETPSPDVDR